MRIENPSLHVDSESLPPPFNKATTLNHIIATDEAGYGPNLGPLAIGATRWKTSQADFDPSTLLSEFVFQQKKPLASFEKQSNKPGLMIADSKAVYSSGKIELLERGVLAGLYAIHGSVPQNVGQLLSMLGVDQDSVQDADYFRCDEIELPLATDKAIVETLGQRMAKTLAAEGAALTELSVALVFPTRFNASVIEMGNKASCLTKESLGLISRMMDSVKLSADDGFDIRCDKHGGRNRYAPAIQEHFGDSWVEIENESRAQSSYRFQNGQAKICFVAKGESWLPIALASMVAKYVRELFMLRWNRFWKTHLPHIKPTKGYPVDARRFKKDIAAAQKKIGIADADIWRIR